ncbi:MULTISPECIES: CobW family GTP-binding protein [Ruegeria]|uniref:CobW family GTP-binding protein n=1 Tax=Ruegeria TaxID=97050 RepID=UPI00147FE40B|nr:GTP-binding protein [Ruegeria lacuscaerulensis]
MTERPHAQNTASRHDQFMRALDQRQTIAGLIFAAMSMPRELAAPARSLPLTIIGGFLGAGKTTLLNRLLADPQGRKIVVLVNDFGKINIDAELIAEQTDDTITLTNGCACCAVASDLSKSLVDIAQRRDRPDAIVLECSGISEPGSIAQIALANEAIRLDGIITVVDAETLEARASDPATRELFNAQLVSADMILLSKLDLLSDESRARAKSRVGALYADTPILEAIEGRIPTDVALGIDTKQDVSDYESPVPEAEHGFETISVETNDALDEKALQQFFSDLPDTILRAKGFVFIAQKPDQRLIFQRVGSRWSMREGDCWTETGPHTRLVFIGPKGQVYGDALRGGVLSCKAQKTR